jgi:beta-lactam-binding protein with PASTA domain
MPAFSQSRRHRDKLIRLGSVNDVQDYLKTFLISLVTAVAVLFLLGPVMLKLNQPMGPRPQTEAPAQAPVEPQQVAPAGLTAPNLQGLALRDARDRWRAEGIVIIEDSQRVDATVEPGTILSQIPAGGAPLSTKEIRVVVSAAPEMVPVPSVIGKSATEATEALVAAGFEVPAPEKEASSEAPGTVLRQEPNAGSKTEKGALVRLVVSGESVAADTGGAVAPASADAVEVPKVVGMQLDRARKKLEDVGLAVGSVRQQEDPELSSRRVLSQKPAAGTEVAAGSDVDLVIVAPD